MKHLVIVKYTDLVQDREAFRREVQALFEPLTEISGIRAVQTIQGLPLRDNRYDLIIAITMDKEALPVYDESAIHKTWKKDYAKYVDKKAIFDCEDEDWI